jgi:uncharacterized protein (DUF1778 family)
MSEEGKSITELNSLWAENETLADLRVFYLTPSVYQQLADQLDMYPQTNEGLRKTMQSQSPWDSRP